MRLLLLFVFTCLFFCQVSSQNKPYKYETEGLIISIRKDGLLEGIYDKSGKVDYIYMQKPSPLMSIRCNGIMETPSSMKVEGNLLVLKFAKNQVEAKIRLTNRKTFLTLELVKIVPVEKVELITWGPYMTTIKESIGETVGVVHNDSFSFGIQALNIKTLGGYPVEENDNDVSFDVIDSSKIAIVKESWKINKFFRGNTASLERFGSTVQAFCRNRSTERIVPNWRHDYYVAPPFNDGGVVGSKVALFGCATGKALDVIGQIELTEGLPHPLIDGIWSKISPTATASYLIIDFDQKNFDEALSLTKKAGLKYLYQSEPFETWGHFKLNEKMFPNNWDGMKRCVEKAESQGVHIGVHTLSNFITTNDPYVTPVPDKRLDKVGSSFLSVNIDSQTKDIQIDSPRFFNQMGNNNVFAVVVGNEVIRYKAVSETGPWVLKDCVRGAFGTTAASHSKGDTISKIMDHGYKTLLTNSALSVEVAEQIAKFFNYTGIRQTSFDGLEGNQSTGMGQYGCQLFTKAWFDKLNPELKKSFINDASRPGHFNWHINTRYNWGEPWYAGFRESQQQSRLKNQDYFRRNFIPSMLGWFKMTSETSIEDAEWLLARAAGFDAGFAFCVNLESAKKNGQHDAIFETIRKWETARLSGAFSKEQKLQMENIDNEFHLEQGGNDGEWNLYPYLVKRYSYQQKIVQPGEPTSESFVFENQYPAQPAIFIMNLMPALKDEEASSINKLSIAINNNNAIEIRNDMEPFQYLKSDGTGKLLLLDRNWNLVKELVADKKILILQHGHNTITIDARFAKEASSILKIEVKTIGLGQKVVATLKK